MFELHYFWVLIIVLSLLIWSNSEQKTLHCTCKLSVKFRIVPYSSRFDHNLICQYTLASCIYVVCHGFVRIVDTFTICMMEVIWSSRLPFVCLINEKRCCGPVGRELAQHAAKRSSNPVRCHYWHLLVQIASSHGHISLHAIEESLECNLR